MQRPQPKWRIDRGARALKTLGRIEASIIALQDEDLLDLHDIFVSSPGNPLGGLAQGEMERRNLKS